MSYCVICGAEPASIFLTGKQDELYCDSCWEVGVEANPGRAVVHMAKVRPVEKTVDKSVVHKSPQKAPLPRVRGLKWIRLSD